MIASLRGTLLSTGAGKAVVDVGGVGYEVILSSDNVARLPERGAELFLFVHTSVREDAITLFGFLEEDEKELFLILKTVAGIGPRLAVAMLSGMRVGEICRAILDGDSRRLTALPGVGKKIAERICVDLRDKVAHLGPASFVSPPPAPGLVPVAGSAAADALSALTNLGYPEVVARGALGAVKKRIGEVAFAELKVEVLIREALRTLA
jgi:holliday junction DNA helicase RuvA